MIKKIAVVIDWDKVYQRYKDNPKVQILLAELAQETLDKGFKDIPGVIINDTVVL